MSRARHLRQDPRVLLRHFHVRSLATDPTSARGTYLLYDHSHDRRNKLPHSYCYGFHTNTSAYQILWNQINVVQIPLTPKRMCLCLA